MNKEERMIRQLKDTVGTCNREAAIEMAYRQGLITRDVYEQLVAYEQTAVAKYAQD